MHTFLHAHVSLRRSQQSLSMCCTNFRSALAVVCYLLLHNSVYIRADWGRHGTLPYRKPRFALHMPKKISDVAIERLHAKLRN